MVIVYFPLHKRLHLFKLLIRQTYIGISAENPQNFASFLKDFPIAAIYVVIEE